MGSILIDTLKAKNDTNLPLYKDIKLDLKKDFILDPKFKSYDVVKDLESSDDIDAIKNSIYNLFTTIPGQKILNPVYGLNILQFLFTGITENNAKMLGDTILRGIRRFEPRIEVARVYVFPDYDNQMYEIGLKLNVPSLNIKGLTIKSTLSESGYYIN